MLDLRSCSVVGSILVSLVNLTSLYLSGNGIIGGMLETLGQLSLLFILDLSWNSLTGSIPSALFGLLALAVLNLLANFLSVAIPPSLETLYNLKTLILTNNSLGSIPAYLGNLSLLVKLNVSFNSFFGGGGKTSGGATSPHRPRRRGND